MQVFEIDKATCRGCMGCFTACPANAIHMEQEKLAIDQSRCIACGSCFRTCHHGAIRRVSELEKVQGFLKAGRKVILSIDPAAGAYLPEGVTLEQLASGAQKLGVWDAADASEAYGAVAAEYVRLMQEKGQENLVFSHCPVVQNLMEQFYPQVLSMLAPVASPMIAHGRMLKRDFTSAAVVYVTTCAARGAECQDVRHSTEINAVITVGELLEWLAQAHIDLKECEEEPLLSEDGGIARLAALPGGMMECVNYLCPDHKKNQLVVEGMSACRALLEELKQGKLSNCVIEMNACQGGCLGGICAPGESRGCFEAALGLRAQVMAGEKEPGYDIHGIAMNNPTIDFSVGEHIPTEEELRQILFQMGVGNPRQRRNCGQCGYATCRERAEAILGHREPVSICEPVVQEAKMDMYSVLYELLPMAALLVDEKQKILDFNQEAADLFGMKRGQEKYIFEIMDPGDVQYVLSTGLSIRHKRIDIPELYLRVEASMVPLKQLGMVLGLFWDVTEEEEEENRQLQSRIQSVEMAQKVIDKQMMVAQQIAFLLGETTAETKVTLNQLKRRILDEEDGT